MTENKILDKTMILEKVLDTTANMIADVFINGRMYSEAEKTMINKEKEILLGMTENKMPDLIWAGKVRNNKIVAFEANESSSETKYFRAEPVESLLKQARDVIAIYNDEYSGYDDLITDIDKLLGEDK